MALILKNFYTLFEYRYICVCNILFPFDSCALFRTRIGQECSPNHTTARHVQHLMLKRHKNKVDTGGRHPKFPPSKQCILKVSVAFFGEFVQLVLQSQSPCKNSRDYNGSKACLIHEYFNSEIFRGSRIKSSI